MTKSDDFQNFAEFWPFYLREHGNPVNRGLHYVGTTGVLICVIYALTMAEPMALVVGLIFGYGLAWIGHFFIQKNRPATFTYPLWSARGDFKMYFCFLTGRIRQEMKNASEDRS